MTQRGRTAPRSEEPEPGEHSSPANNASLPTREKRAPCTFDAMFSLGAPRRIPVAAIRSPDPHMHGCSNVREGRTLVRVQHGLCGGTSKKPGIWEVHPCYFQVCATQASATAETERSGIDLGLPRRSKAGYTCSPWLVEARCLRNIDDT